MTVNLIPQDELTLDLLAEVLAEMYRYSLNGKNVDPENFSRPDHFSSGAGLEERRRGKDTTERETMQTEKVRLSPTRDDAGKRGRPTADAPDGGVRIHRVHQNKTIGGMRPPAR